MANIPIRDMTATGSPDDADYIVFDDGQMKKGTVSDLRAPLLRTAGGTMTGPLILAADPTTALQPSTKQYVDNAIASGGPEVSAAGGGVINVASSTGALIITGAALTATTVNLPSVSSRSGRPLRIADWSSSVADHAILLEPDGSETIMRVANWPIYSSAAQLAGITLYPSTNLSGWYIAP